MLVGQLDPWDEIGIFTLPETNIFAPENGCLEYFLVSFWVLAPFSGAKLLLVSGRVPIHGSVNIPTGSSHGS